jgi:hypothetical protein
MNPIEITRVAKTGGPLTKRIYINDTGKVVSDGSACVMGSGIATRAQFPDLAALAGCIGSLAQHEAIILGRLRGDLPDRVEITTKGRLDEMNGAAAPNIIARTSTFISYRPGHAGLALLDYDTKGMPPDVAERIKALGGFWPALLTVLPALATSARLLRNSTSSGLYRHDTGEQLPGSSGVHVYVAVADGADTERFLKTLHDRCWLAGLGWMMVGAGGQMLERSIVDRMVGAPERLVFEGAPVLDAPLAQDQDARRPIVREGDALDTVAHCPPLTLVEKSKLKEMRAKDGYRLAPDAAKARDAFIEEQSARLATRTGMSPADAKQVIARQCRGVLLPHIALPFDDEALTGTTVADVLADPARYEGETLADPLEGIPYGTCKAKIMRRPDGSPWINSFAHGRTTYELKLDAGTVEAALNRAPANEAAALFVRLALQADLDTDETERLRDLTAARVGVGKRAIAQKLKAAQAEHDHQRYQDERQRRAAERQDPRPQIEAPAPDAPWLPIMDALNDVLAASPAAEPPMRDIDGIMVEVKVRRLPNMHALTSAGANEDETDDARLPPPEQPLLTRMEEPQLAEMIERHIDFIEDDGRPVHLGSAFVHHFHKRPDDRLPIGAAIATLPAVLADGTLLAGVGLDRDRGIIFRIPPELMTVLPRREDCTPGAVAEAMRFLTEDWLCDVAADYTGKACLIAAALTVIERSLLPERPVFFVTAGRRGGGKTTALIMLLMAVTGVRPSAAAWSTNEEERRKALLAYLMEAIAAIVWDNIPRGTQISCPHIEKACTTAFYSDRRLGVSEMVAVAASVVQFFTGNNIGPRGDLASRSLSIRLEVDRADPENRPFTHPDPIGWTEANRARILRALYTVLLGNPAVRPGANVAAETRFKTWWRLVGSAIEHAAQQHHEHVTAFAMDKVKDGPETIRFRDLFLSQEDDDEETASLAETLGALAATNWPKIEGQAPGTFQAADVARLLNDRSITVANEVLERAATVREFLFPKHPDGQTVTPKSVGKRLKAHAGEPVRVGDQTFTLMAGADPHTKVTVFHVRQKAA